MELRLEQVADEAEAYAAGPRPPAPRPSKGKGKKKAAPRAPEARGHRDRAEDRDGPGASGDQATAPAWQQARVTELSDESSVKKAVKDLSFLSRESKAYRTCTSALAQIKKALSAKSG